MSDFFIGAGFWWRGWVHLITRPKLLLLAFIPMILSIAMTVLFISLVFVQLPTWVQALTQYLMGTEPTAWANLLHYSVLIFGGLMIIVGFIYLGYLLHRVIAAPFYGWLAERTLRSQGVVIDGSWRNILRMFWVSVGQTFVFAALGVTLFIASLIPALNVIALLVTLLLLAFDLCGYAFEPLGYSLRQRFEFLGRHKTTWAGMAAGVGLTLMVPGLTLLVIPGAVAGAALIVGEKLKNSAEKIS